MSYINKTYSPLVNSKITAKGRQNLAAGKLNFKYYVFGDGEVDYNKVTIDDYILKPKDFNPDIKTFLLQSDCNPFRSLDSNSLKVIECCLHNKIASKGFFNLGNLSTTLNVDQKYVKKQATVFSQQLNGSTSINLGHTDFEDGDFILFKIVNPTVGELSATETDSPVIYLWFRLTTFKTSTVITLDRPLPYLNYNNVEVNYYIVDKNFKYFDKSNSHLLWDYNNLEFKESCLEEDTFVWNFNAVWNEDFIGVQDTQEKFTDFGSYAYVGQKEYLGYNLKCPQVINNSAVDCHDKLNGILDDIIRGIGIIHYSNMNIKNQYGEYFHISEADNTKVEVVLPTIMWHGRDFGGSTLGTHLGMVFESDITTLKHVDNTNIEYYDLIESSLLIQSGQTPMVVGRVYHQLKIITVHNPELLAALSYKSNRNFTLPPLKGKMVQSQNNNGILLKNKSLYLTYSLEANESYKYCLPQQQYLRFDNSTSTDKDIEFTIENINRLPYMRKKESVGYDGLGFYAHKIKILYQITDIGERPKSNSWISVDYTNNVLTNFVNDTIDPFKLENQNAAEIGFKLNIIKVASGITYNIGEIGYPDINCPDIMNFGDEVFLFGNINAYAGACIYKNVIELQLDEGLFVNSTNPTWSNQQLRISEVGIYDDKYNLVMIAKLYNPIEIIENSLSLFQIEHDF